MGKILFWSTTLLIGIATIYLSRHVLTPFIASLLLSYFVSPLADKLENNYKCNRSLISFGLVSIIVIVFFALWILLLPLVYEQISYFLKSIPKYKVYINNNFVPFIKDLLEKLDPTYSDKIHTSINKFSNTLFKELVSLVHKIWESSFAVVHALLTLILLPLLTFYFIKDWRKLSNTIEKLVPMDSKYSYKNLAKDINATLSGFIRGQINVCLVLAVYYAAALSFINLEFGIFIGITTGILSFIPFLGLLGGFVISILVAAFQFQTWVSIVSVVVVFLIGNIIESVLSPKLIGNKLGLHPVWIIFFVLLGGSLFNFIGMLLAIPVGATIAVIIKFLINKYYNSAIYK